MADTVSVQGMRERKPLLAWGNLCKAYDVFAYLADRGKSADGF